MEEQVPLPLEDILAEVLDEARPLRDAAVADLSDLDRAGRELFRQCWSRAGVGRRRLVISRMVELAEDNFDLDFDRVFLVALEDADPVVRARAASGLSQSEDVAVVSPLVRLLVGDSSEPVRVAAAQALGKAVMLAELGKVSERQALKVRGALLGVVEDRREGVELRRRSLESLSPWASPRVAALIEDAYHSGDPGFRASAVYAMGMSCDSRWLSILFDELLSDDPRLRCEAAHSCGEIAGPEAVPHLLGLLHDEDIEVRLAVIWALGQIGGREAKEALRSLLEGDDRVKEAVEGALAEIHAGEGLV
ncbi:MAG: HEAT repeat domain-containing protein [Chloroflexota bacterium]